MNTRIVAADRKYYTQAASGLATHHDVDPNPSYFFTVVMNNHHATDDRWLQLFDATELPADTTPPLASIKIPAGSTGTIDFGHAIPMASGIVVACSTTGPLLTITGSDEAKFFVAWKRKA
jgi:hypothetical protein